ncbi:glycoside hydrolase family 5 protein [Conidiobolus coronatus NRRL 28638]|uniref:Glycoside hydrolase family 5 protein n=1 Tax=Conidiobolus coronatus (strain ATCC 28846 / CBS 209.66 / NRRL 28638) TaxID=796925 RepID=A0A137P9J2_CONC2|nr:glycoside hydrolase family 5 protein [Conidiobolus coronatus NRRL 28638]|eukprot:KXN71670.1 glycoside hydrolase family 5 protein [Conidiobolus coronatus NRRL 28638]
MPPKNRNKKKNTGGGQGSDNSASIPPKSAKRNLKKQNSLATEEVSQVEENETIDTGDIAEEVKNINDEDEETSEIVDSNNIQETHEETSTIEELSHDEPIINQEPSITHQIEDKELSLDFEIHSNPVSQPEINDISIEDRNEAEELDAKLTGSLTNLDLDSFSSSNNNNTGLYDISLEHEDETRKLSVLDSINLDDEDDDYTQHQVNSIVNNATETEYHHTPEDREPELNAKEAEDSHVPVEREVELNSKKSENQVPKTKESEPPQNVNKIEESYRPSLLPQQDSHHTREISEDIEIYSPTHPIKYKNSEIINSREIEAPSPISPRSPIENKIEPLPAIRLTSETGEDEENIQMDETPEMTALKLAQDLGYDPNLVDDIMLSALATDLPQVPGEEEEEPPLPMPSLGATNWNGLQIKANKNFITDQFGRQLSLRGVALTGSCRLPNPNPPAKNKSGKNVPPPEKIDDATDSTPIVTFENLPFPLHEAEEHFERLKLWGMTVIRLVVPWEAIEHAGPGIYDDNYIDYLIKLCDMADDRGFKIIIDPRQEAWSRHCGGTGAPAWTLEVAGLDVSALEVTAAAYIDPTTGPISSTIEPLDLPKDDTYKKHSDQLWLTNHNRLACSTMFTLFFAGSTFAPCRLYKNQFVQEFLQKHYCNAYEYLAQRLNVCKSIIGFFTMPNIHQGYIGLASLSKFEQDPTIPQYGLSPSPLQGMALAEGVTQSVPVMGLGWTGAVKVVSNQQVNTEEIRAWLPKSICPWREAGAWDMDPIERSPKALDDSYFCKYLNGSTVNFPNQYFLPFINRFIQSIRNVAPDLTIFISPIPNTQLQVYPQVENVVYCPSFYDINVNLEKKFDGMVTQDRLSQLATGQQGFYANTYYGLQGAKKCYSKQLGMLHEWGQISFGQPIPMIIGELGIPFNLNQSKAYTTGDYTNQSNLLDCMLSSLEESHKGFFVWHYQPDNNNEIGDKFNNEDFSIICKANPPPIRKDKAYNPLFVGGRCLDSLIRPFPTKVAGQVKFFEYYPESGEFHLEFTTQVHKNKNLDDQTYSQFIRQTEIYLPTYHYRHKTLIVHISDGLWRYEPELQTLYYWHQTETGIDTYEDRPLPKLPPKTNSEENDNAAVDDDGDPPEDMEGLDEHEDNFHSSTVPDPDPFELIHDPNNPEVLLHSLRVMVKEYTDEQDRYY